MQLDQLPSYVIVVAATNHGELLDRAVWRRFQMRLAMPAPRKAEIVVFLDRITSNWSESPALPLPKIAAKLGNVSYAEALDFCQNVRRRQILGLGEVSVDAALHTELDLWTKRVTPEVLNAERSDKALLRLTPQAERRRALGRQRNMPSPEAFPGGRQAERIGPKFTRLAELLARGGDVLELRADATALAPERLSVFEVRGAIGTFADAVRRVPGLELVDEEEMNSDELDKQPVAYLMVPDLGV